jgi:hypothetical protein
MGDVSQIATNSSSLENVKSLARKVFVVETPDDP